MSHESDAVRSRYLAIAKTYEERGEVDRAAESYARAGSMGNAARVLVGAGRPADAGRLLLQTLGVEPEEAGTLEGVYRAVALRAAECFHEAGDLATAERLFGALGVETRPLPSDAARLGVGPTTQSERSTQRPPPRPRSQRTPVPATTAEGSPRATAPPPRAKRSLGGGSRAAGWKDVGKSSSAHDQMIADLLAKGRETAAARVMWDSGRFEEASGYFQKADMPYEAGMCLVDAGKLEEAFPLLLRVPPAHKRYRKACVRVIHLARQLDLFDFDVDRMVSAFVGGGPRQEEEADAYALLARMYEAGGFHDAAVDTARRLLGFAPDHPDARRLLEALAPGALGSSVTASGALAGPRDGLPDLPDLDTFIAPSTRSAPPRAATPVSVPPPAGRQAETLPEVPHPSSAPPAPPPSPPPQAEPVPIAVGHVIAGRYDLRELVGEGGMAIVYRALDLELDREIALKVLRPLPSLVSWLPRFRQELALSRELTHKNIVRVFDIGKHEGTSFISMELLRGYSLDARVDQPMPIGEAIELLLQACAGLRVAHEKQIVHRDIKPENMFVCDDGTLKLMDFGIATAPHVKGMTSVGSIVGTPDYMAPEQISSADAATPQSDLYSLGVVMYEMFTGTLPFQSENLMGLLHQQVSVAPEPPSRRNPAISGELEALILRLLAKDPAERFPSAAEVARALRAAHRDRR